MTMVSIHISETLYERLRQRAARITASPDELAESLLRQELDQPYPHITIETSRFGQRAVIQGTRVGVASIVAYERLGLTPEKIVADILPHLSLLQVQEALNYFREHVDEIEQELTQDSEGPWFKRLRELAGNDEAFIQMTGGRIPINGE